MVKGFGERIHPLPQSPEQAINSTADNILIGHPTNPQQVQLLFQQDNAAVLLRQAAVRTQTQLGVLMSTIEALLRDSKYAIVHERINAVRTEIDSWQGKAEKPRRSLHSVFSPEEIAKFKPADLIWFAKGMGIEIQDEEAANDDESLDVASPAAEEDEAA